MFFGKFRNLARYYGWNDDDCLLALNVSEEGPVLRYYHIILSGVKRMTLGEIFYRLEQRFGKGLLHAASQVEFSSMTTLVETTAEIAIF